MPVKSPDVFPWCGNQALIASLLAVILAFALCTPARAQTSLNPVTTAEKLTHQVVGLNKRLQHASPNARERIYEELRTLANERRLLLSMLMQSDPSAVLRVAIPANIRNGMPDAIRALIEQRQDVEGELVVFYEDHEDGGYRLHHVLNILDERISLHFRSTPFGLLTGMPVRARGVLLGDAMAMESGENILILSADGGSGGGSNGGTAAPLPDTLGEQQTAVLLINFASMPEEPWTVEQAHASVFGPVSDFIQENSYGQTWLNGDVFGWLTIDLDPAGCPVTDITIEANRAATGQGINLSGYNRIIYAFPDIGCSWSGQATIGGSPSSAWIDGTLLNAGIVTHELGHTFGLYHSHALECGTDVVGSNCLTAEYGDALDRMGNHSAGHFNTFQKLRLGWLDHAASPPTVTAGSSGSYHLDAYAAQAQGNKALRLPRNTDPVTGQSSWYFLEYREALGFDSFLSASRYAASVTNGVVFRLGTEGDPNSISLLDMTPNSQQFDWDDMALGTGNSYTDTGSGTTITLEQIDATGAVISVDFGTGACVHNSPAIALSPSQGPWVSPGMPVSYQVTVTSNDSDPCLVSAFDLSTDMPAGWTVELSSTTLQIAPGESRVATMTVTSADTGTEGFHEIIITAIHNNDADLSASAMATYVIEPDTSDTEAPSVPTGLSAGITKKQINLTWNQSSDNVGVTGYRIWRDGVILAETPDNSYADRAISDNIAYQYTIDAYDASGNISAQSEPVLAGRIKSKGNDQGGGKGKRPGR